jgi:hypothetical protein
MFDKEHEYDEAAQPIARCADCGELIYDDSKSIYLDDDGNYFCNLECALNYYGIHQAEDCLVGD